ncbi:MAG TPA: hypothetical protein VFB16_00785 [Bauldia sp.]|nr:hypothetical protein [Bauldia sp.]
MSVASIESSATPRPGDTGRLTVHLGWISVAVLSLAGGVLITWSQPLCESFSSDSLLPAVMSVQRVTPYFWGQDRFGSLLPALASWIGDIGLSLRFQVFLRDASASLFPLFTILVLRPRAPLAWTFPVALLAMLAVSSFPMVRQFWPYNQPYGPSFALLAAALAVLRIPATGRGRLLLRGAGCFALMLTATWVNSGLGLVVAPLFAVLFLLRRDGESLTFLAMTLVAYLLVTRLIPSEWHWDYETFAFDWRSFLRLPSIIAASVRPVPGTVALVLLVVSSVVFFRRRETSTRAIAEAALAIILAASVGALVTVQVGWVAGNDFQFRYFSVEVELLITLAAILAVEALWRRRLLPAGPWSAVPSLAALATMAYVTAPFDFACRFLPSSVVAITDAAAKMAVATGARFIAGDFWIARPAVYAANEMAGTNTIFGASPRGGGATPRIAEFMAREPSPTAVCMNLAPVACAHQVALVARHGAVVAPGPPIAEERTPSGAVLRAIRLSWAEELAIPVEGLSTQVGTPEGGGFAVKGPAAPGFLVFGPYTPVPAGDLTVSTTIACDGPVTGSYLDVSAHKGSEILARLPLDTIAGLCDGTPKPVRMSLRLAGGRSDVEFRTYYGGSGNLAVTEVAAYQPHPVFGR